MAEIFLSYARQDERLAKALSRELEAAGLDVWLDLYSLEGGDEWEPQIEAAIHEADVFIACLSSRSIADDCFVWKELERALARHAAGELRLVPVCFDDCAIPEALHRYHAIDAFDAEQRRALIRSLAGQTSRERGPNTVESPTLAWLGPGNWNLEPIGPHPRNVLQQPVRRIEIELYPSGFAQIHTHTGRSPGATSPASIRDPSMGGIFSSNAKWSPRSFQESVTIESDVGFGTSIR